MPVRTGILVAIACFAPFTTQATAIAQALSPYSEFQGLSAAELATVQGKLTDVGTHLRGLPTLAFSVNGHPVDLSVFAPFYRTGFSNSYGGDQSKGLTFAISSAEMSSLIDSVATLPAVTDGGVDGYLSLSLSVVKSGTTKVFESIIDETSSKAVFQKMLGAFSGNAVATQAVREHACTYGMLPGSPMADVTSAVSIRVRGFRKDRTSGQYVGTVRVSNTGAQAIQAPIVFVCRPPENMSLTTSEGFTCAVFPSGAPYQTVSASALGPGQHADIVVRVSNPDADEIELAYQRVYSGTGNK